MGKLTVLIGAPSNGGDGAVDSVNGKTGIVLLNGTDIPLLNGTTTPTVTDSIADLSIEVDKKVDSVTTGEPTGSYAIGNIVSLTQAEYDAGTKIATTIYNITDA